MGAPGVNVKRGLAPSIVPVSMPGIGSGEARPPHDLVQLISLQQVFDIYIPEAIFEFQAVTKFLTRLGALSEGATLYQGVDGDWYHESEAVRVLRMSITITKPDGTVLWTEESIREAIANLVCELTVELRDIHGHAEEAIFFNDWQAKGTVIREREASKD